MNAWVGDFLPTGVVFLPRWVMLMVQSLWGTPPAGVVQGPESLAALDHHPLWVHSSLQRRSGWCGRSRWSPGRRPGGTWRKLRCHRLTTFTSCCSSRRTANLLILTDIPALSRGAKSMRMERKLPAEEDGGDPLFLATRYAQTFST